ncbi:MAG: hypothetical protein MUC51_03100 [Anaerolineae bacterium]|jgi:hypothetical protein|nr:hypothetical protein [Anaerolineae bacterium]
MAKKKTTRRVPQSSTPRMYGDGKPSQVAAGAAPTSGASARPAGAAAAAARGPVDLAKEYSYVAGDLKRLGIVAAALFAMLIALSFII